MRISDWSSDVCSSDLGRPDRRNRMRLGDLAVLVLQQIGLVAMEDAGASAGKAGGMLAGLDPAPGRFDSDHLYLRVIEERVEQADGVRSPADAGDQQVGQAEIGRAHV